MERLKNMGLRKAFYCLSFVCLSISLALAMLLYNGINQIEQRYPSGGVAIQSDGTIIELEKPTPPEQKTRQRLEYLQILTLVLLPLSGLEAAGVLFYRWKLKPSIEALQSGTAQIRNHNLDFTIPEISGDELGQVCAAFETMRAELLRTNQELWRQAEERKRLNAAFSHDLRNPVTVLKGTVQLLRRGVPDAQALDRLEYYTARIEQYIEAMSSVQRLEQLPVQRKRVGCSRLRTELNDSAKLLAPRLTTTVLAAQTGTVSLDHELFLTVAENLVSNAARFAKETLLLCLEVQPDALVLTVSDDGPGFPPELLRKDGDGIKPFEHTGKDAEHFGMGLYICQLLCVKHGGSLRLENDGGAKVTAVFGGMSSD